MSVIIRFSFRILLALGIWGSPAFAQSGKSVKLPETKASKVLGSQLNTILDFASFGGAIGLSTLSFYGRPQDKLAHIPVGIALGIIAGAIYSTSQMVTEPLQQTAQLEEEERFAQEPMPPLVLNWKFDF